MKETVPFSKLTIFALIALLTGCAAKQAGPPAGMRMEAPLVRIAASVQEDVPLDFSAVGNVESMAAVDVKSRVAGQVLRVHFEEGQTVHKGDLLFEIDPEPLRRQLAEIQANLAKDEAMEQQAHANVEKDEAQIKQTRAAADRGVQLAKEGIFSREQTEQVVATNDSALASLAADKAAINSAAASSKADRARLAQTELQLSYTKITAPITGRAGAIAVKAGNLIKDNDAAMVTLLQMSPIYVTFAVPEQLLPDVRKFNVGHPLEVTAAAQTGVLAFIDSSVDSGTGTIKLKARFENGQAGLWPGEFVNVQARLTVEKDRVVIPSRSVQTGPQGKYVWVLNPSDNTVAMRPVNVERLYKADGSPEKSVIGTGIKAGETVISEGQMRLLPGVKVQLMKQDGGTS